MRAAIHDPSPPCWPAARPPRARRCATCPPPASASVPARPTCRPSAWSSADAIDKIMQAALAEIDVREAYELDMRAALVGCVKQHSSGSEICAAVAT